MTTVHYVVHMYVESLSSLNKSLHITHTKNPAIKAIMMKSQITQHLQKKDHTSQIQNKYHIRHLCNKRTFQAPG